MRVNLFILFALCLLSAVYPQTVTGWELFSAKSNVKSIELTSGGVWAAANGGAFYFNFADSTYISLNRQNGLHGIYLTAVTVDNDGKVWFGSSDGIIDVYSPSGSVKTILDIYNSDKTSKQINGIRISGDTAIVSTDYGITLIGTKEYIIYDTYFKYGDLQASIKVNDSFKDELFYAATDYGVAIQKPGSTNLSAPESWTTYTVANGLPSAVINKLIKYNSVLIAATDKGIAAFNGVSWENVSAALTNLPINDLKIDNGTLLLLGNDNIVYSYSNGTVTPLYNSPASIREIEVSGTGIWGASSSGVAKVSNGSFSLFYQPNSPAANQFVNTTVDNNGVFWAATGRDNNGVGLLSYDKTNWNVLNTSNSTIPINSVYCIYAASDNVKYFGTWGRGFSKLDNGVIKTYNAENTNIIGTSENPLFLVVSSLASDSKNNIWGLNFKTAGSKSLIMLTNQDSIYQFKVSSEAGQYLTDRYSLVVDQYDTKWYLCKDAGRPGVFYFNENKTFDNTNDDVSGYLSVSSLTGSAVTSIVVDKRGDIWIGTASGVEVITNPVEATTSSPQFNKSSLFALRQQTVNCILVDPLNQKWIGTNQGLLLVNSDGTSLLAAYDTKNSILPSDVITSLSMDEKTGVIYAGTESGLAALKTISIKPAESFTGLFVYPSPFLIKDGSGNLTIDGLIKDSDIKILSVSGKLIAEFSSPGGYRAFWNGKDMDGNLVSSGIYLVVAYDKEGNNVTTGKIAVLRQ